MAEVTRNASEKGEENSKGDPKEQESIKTVSVPVLVAADKKPFLVTEKFISDVLGVRFSVLLWSCFVFVQLLF